MVTQIDLDGLIDNFFLNKFVKNEGIFGNVALPCSYLYH